MSTLTARQLDFSGHPHRPRTAGVAVRRDGGARHRRARDGARGNQPVAALPDRRRRVRQPARSGVHRGRRSRAAPRAPPHRLAATGRPVAPVSADHARRPDHRQPVDRAHADHHARPPCGDLRDAGGRPRACRAFRAVVAPDGIRLGMAGNRSGSAAACRGTHPGGNRHVRGDAPRVRDVAGGRVSRHADGRDADPDGARGALVGLEASFLCPGGVPPPGPVRTVSAHPTDGRCDGRRSASTSDTRTGPARTKGVRAS